MNAKKSNGAAAALIIVAFVDLIVGMMADGMMAYLCLGSAIVIFLVAIVMQVAGATSKE